MSGSSGGGGGSSAPKKKWRPTATPVKKTSKSASSEGGALGGGGGGGVAKDPCNISVEVTLNSVDQAVLSKSKVGDSVTIDLLQPPKRVVAKKDKKNLGSITSGVMLQLIECLEDGAEYAGKITYIMGGVCKIKIERSA